MCCAARNVCDLNGLVATRRGMNGRHLCQLRGDLLDNARQAVRHLNLDVQYILTASFGNDAPRDQVESLESLQHSRQRARIGVSNHEEPHPSTRLRRGPSVRTRKPPAAAMRACTDQNSAGCIRS